MIREWDTVFTLPEIFLNGKKYNVNVINPDELFVPVFIDYAFSKKIDKGFFPMEPFRLINKMYNYFDVQPDSEITNNLKVYFRLLYTKIDNIISIFEDKKVILWRKINEPNSSFIDLMETLPVAIGNIGFELEMDKLLESLFNTSTVAQLSLSKSDIRNIDMVGGSKRNNRLKYLKYKIKYLMLQDK
jgi:hypothetical protein